MNFFLKLYITFSMLLRRATCVFFLWSFRKEILNVIFVYPPAIEFDKREFFRLCWNYFIYAESLQTYLLPLFQMQIFVCSYYRVHSYTLWSLAKFLFEFSQIDRSFIKLLPYSDFIPLVVRNRIEYFSHIFRFISFSNTEIQYNFLY